MLLCGTRGKLTADGRWEDQGSIPLPAGGLDSRSSMPFVDRERGGYRIVGSPVEEHESLCGPTYCPVEEMNKINLKLTNK